MRKQSQALEPVVADWLGENFKSFFRLKKVSPKERKGHLAHAKQLLEAGRANPHFHIFFKGAKPAGLFSYGAHPHPRIKNQKVMEFYFDPRAKKDFLQWMKPFVRDLAAKGPVGTNLNFVPGDEAEFESILKRAGGYVRSDILMGEVDVALKNLISKKKPLKDLSHLGLRLEPIKNVRELPKIMKVQKRVSLREKEHTYFSHLKEQLTKDEAEYKTILKDQMGLILGVYKGEKLVGVMITTIIPGSSKATLAGMSFFLDKSIQGRGVVTIGYLHLLDFLSKRKIKSFVGGTSQPAVKGLASIMKRTCRRVNYVRMSVAGK